MFIFFSLVRNNKAQPTKPICTTRMFHAQKWPEAPTQLLPETHIAELANSVDLDEVAHFEPPHLDLHYLPSSL